MITVESIFGGGKSIRDGQDQCPLEEPMSPRHCDLVITNAVIIDHWGIVKGDIGIKDGRIVAVGKSGNPLTQSGVDPRITVCRPDMGYFRWERDIRRYEAFLAVEQ